MTKIITLDGHRGPWISGPVVCVRCLHNWVAVRPFGATWLECPRCGATMGGSLALMIKNAVYVLGHQCCGQRDSEGICCAPACDRGTALRLIDAIGKAYNLEHDE